MFPYNGKRFSGGAKHVSIEWKCVFAGGESRAGAFAPFESLHLQEAGEKREGGGRKGQEENCENNGFIGSR